MGQSVEVSTEVAALQTDSATVGTIVGHKQVDDLPLNGRNFLLLAQIVPGANNYVGSFANGGLDPLGGQQVHKSVKFTPQSIQSA